jgi:hypothetical protein
MRARTYAPTVGRFLSRDVWPVDYGNPFELNRYVYAANNPVRWSDPSGFMAEMAITFKPSRVSAPAVALVGRSIEISFVTIAALMQGHEFVRTLREILDVPPRQKPAEREIDADDPTLEPFRRYLDQPAWRRFLERLMPRLGLDPDPERRPDPVLDPRPDPISPKDDWREDYILVSHYTSQQAAIRIISTGVISTNREVTGQTGFMAREYNVYVLEGRSTASRAADAGAISTEVRIVFDARRIELEIDPEQIDRREDMQSIMIPESRRFIRPGPVSLEGRT